MKDSASKTYSAYTTSGPAQSPVYSWMSGTPNAAPNPAPAYAAPNPAPAYAAPNPAPAYAAPNPAPAYAAPNPAPAYAAPNPAPGYAAPNPAPGYAAPNPAPAYAAPNPAPGYAAPNPAPNEKSAGAPGVTLSDRPLFEKIKIHIEYQIAAGGKYKTGYHWGGADDEGYLELTTDSMSIYKKSKGIALAFGAIGSAIEGKGKLQTTISRSAVVSYEKTRGKKNNVAGYTMQFNDGRGFKMVFLGGKRMDGHAEVTAMDRFLTQRADGIVP